MVRISGRRRAATAAVGRTLRPSRPNHVFDFDAFLGKVGAGKTIAHCARGEAVFRQGDAADAVLYIQKGKVQVTVLSKQGKEAVIAILGAGNFVGEGCLNGQVRRLTTATAMTDCSITRIAKAAMIRVLYDEPAFSDRFIAFLLQRSSRIEEDLVDQLFNSSEKRLARILLLLANFGKADTPEAVTPPISQQTLAEMVGTTRSRVNTFMNKFRRLGLVEYNGELRVHGSLMNVVLHE